MLREIALFDIATYNVENHMYIVASYHQLKVVTFHPCELEATPISHPFHTQSTKNFIIMGL